MTHSRPVRVLIATAGFGDGHNTAARGIAMALEGRADSLIIDPSAKATPRFNNLLRATYRFITTYLPDTWEKIYDGVEQRDFSQQKFPFRRRMQQTFTLQVNEFDPDIIVSTFPLYPSYFEHYVREGGRPRPVITARVWLPCPLLPNPPSFLPHQPAHVQCGEGPGNTRHSETSKRIPTT